jgi:hypothetical protein
LIGIYGELPDMNIFRVEVAPKELEEIVIFLEDGKASEGLLAKKRKIIAMKVAPFTLINGYLYKL